MGKAAKVVPCKFLTIAEIARALDVPRHRVAWIIKARAILHAAELGDQHGYTPEAMAEAKRELQLIDARR